MQLVGLPLKILIIEDEPSIATMLDFNVHRSGYETTCVTGVPECLTHDSILDAFDEQGPVPVKLSEHAVAFVDGRLQCGQSRQGWEIAPVLEKAGIVCVGMSASDQAKFVGITHICDKSKVVGFIYSQLAEAYRLGCTRVLQQSPSGAA